MQHISEVAKILEGAIRHDPRQAINYATLLVEKLEAEGESRQTRLLRGILNKGAAKAVTGTAMPQQPRDEDSRFSTVDVEFPGVGAETLFFQPQIQDRVNEFVEAVEKRALLASNGLEISPRLLIHGEPGTGKTSLARSIAIALNLPLVTTRSDTLVSSLLGQTSKNLRQVFEYASQWPCVLFLDEFDALAKDRADSREVGELQRVVIALLQNIDALDGSVVLIAATNHPQLLDPAVWRRFDFKIATELPKEPERARMWANNMHMLTHTNADIAVFAEVSDGMSGASIRSAAIDIARSEVLSGSDTLRLPRALRRLAKSRWYENADSFDGGAQEAMFLRNWIPRVFTYRVLAELMETNVRKISTYLKDIDVESNSVDSSRSLRAE